MSDDSNRLYLHTTCDGITILCGTLTRTMQRDSKLNKLLNMSTTNTNEKEKETHKMMAKENDDMMVKVCEKQDDELVH